MFNAVFITAILGTIKCLIVVWNYSQSCFVCYAPIVILCLYFMNLLYCMCECMGYCTIPQSSSLHPQFLFSFFMWWVPHVVVYPNALLTLKILSSFSN